MGDGLVGLLPYFQGVSFAGVAAALAIVWRLYLGSDRRLREEQKQLDTERERFERDLDAERDRRRKAEDQMDILSREIRASTLETNHQSGEISRLSAEVTRLRTLLGPGK